MTTKLRIPGKLTGIVSGVHFLAHLCKDGNWRETRSTVKRRIEEDIEVEERKLNSHWVRREQKKRKKKKVVHKNALVFRICSSFSVYTSLSHGKYTGIAGYEKR